MDASRSDALISVTQAELALLEFHFRRPDNQQRSIRLMLGLGIRPFDDLDDVRSVAAARGLVDKDLLKTDGPSPGFSRAAFMVGDLLGQLCRSITCFVEQADKAVPLWVVEAAYASMLLVPTSSSDVSVSLFPDGSSLGELVGGLVRHHLEFEPSEVKVSVIVDQDVYGSSGRGVRATVDRSGSTIIESRRLDNIRGGRYEFDELVELIQELVPLNS